MKCTLLFLLMLIPAFGFSAERLPEAGLRRAQEAEKRLSANKPEDAIQLFKSLDKDYPGRASISLRLAQIHDKLNQKGLALHYYRRYVRISGEKAMEEAQMRASALELDPVAKQAADDYAVKVGQLETQAPVPTPQVNRAIAALKQDGTLEELKGPKDLERVMTTSGTTEGGSEPPAAADPATTRPPLVFTPPPEPENETISIEGTGTDVSTRNVSSKRRATGVKVEVSKPVRKAVPTQISVPGEVAPSLSGNEVRANRITEPSAATERPARMANVFTSPAAGTPNAAANSAAQTFFAVQQKGGPEASISIGNNLGAALMTFKAVSEATGKSTDAILGGNESRTFNFKPGMYRISMQVKTSNYPPSTVLDRTLTIELKAGHVYSKTVSGDTLQISE